MNSKEYYDNCEKCGRPMTYAKPCGCKYESSCLSEYKSCMPACIKFKKPDCLAKAVIPAVNVDSEDGITKLADCFVHTTNTNKTYYIDDKHRPMMVWAGPVETETLADAEALGLKSQTAYTTIDGVYSEVYFDKTGTAHVIGTEA